MKLENKSASNSAAVVAVQNVDTREVGSRGGGDLSSVVDLAKALDSQFQIPGTNIRFGFDSLLGLIPGVGDVASALMAVYILSEARRVGVSRLTMSRMTANVVIDAVVGSVPIAGDAFDVYWKSNQRNVDLLQRHVASGGTDSAQARRSDIVFFVFASVAVLTAITLSLWLAFWAMTLLSRPFR